MCINYILCKVHYLRRIWDMGMLRFCKTAITWLRSLSAILPLFWCHDIAQLHRLCREDLKNVLWHHEICNIFNGIWLMLYKTCSFSQYFTTKLNIFSLNFTGESDFFNSINLLVRTTNFLSVVFNKIWIIRYFAVVKHMVLKVSFCSNLYADAIANIILLHIFINLKIVVHKMIHEKWSWS